MFTIPLTAVVAVLAAILLALITAGIVARRRVRSAYAASLRAVRKLGEPMRRKRRLTQRRAAADGSPPTPNRCGAPTPPWTTSLPPGSSPNGRCTRCASTTRA
ncbi:hypothetical protein E4K10_44605 [Streptomyces sp. T1317-0309]|nr:hypothetical protein E4K10_44605 [Streptomyces sp. T1317-0309]